MGRFRLTREAESVEPTPLRVILNSYGRNIIKKNADKVSSFCNDVIGDICGIISGSVGVTISLALSQYMNIFAASLLVTAIIAALTIGGKAIFKSIAINQSNEILYGFAKFVSIFKK